jgi:RNA-directed DNA polymerase
MSYKAHVHGHGESHSGVLPTKGSNAGQGGPQETVEGRPLTKENAEEPNPYWTQSQTSGLSGLDRVRQAAQRDKQLRFTALLHHVNIDLLRSSYYDLKRQAAAGVDGVTWQEYGDGLEERPRLADLHGRIHRGAYRAQPSRRVWIDKDDGRKRPLGIAALEDKIVQFAVVQVLNPIWEEDFPDFSYGVPAGAPAV